MNHDSTHDDLLLSVLRDKGQILPFLDAIFGFLFRRTDFYIKKDNPNSKLGFPPGVAEQTVRHTFLKWQGLATSHNTLSSKEGLEDVVIHEEEVATTQEITTEEAATEPGSTVKEEKTEKEDFASETYNGAHCGHYWWSQTFQEVDIKIPVAKNVSKSRDVKVDIQSRKLTVKTRSMNGAWETQLDDTFLFSHNKEESVWTLLPGKQITVHLEKAKEMWWDRLFEAESKLDLNQLDLYRDASELPAADKMQVEKAMLQEERKRIEHEEKLDILKKAWDTEGSPFQGTQLDPSILQFSPSLN